MSLHRATILVVAATLALAAQWSHASSSGTLSFKTEATSVSQNARTDSFPVAREGGSTGAAGAVCKAVSGTAVLGKDFKMVNSSLQWASGDASMKSCGVAILDAEPYSGDKAFTLELTSVTGAKLGTSKQSIVINGNKMAGKLGLSAAAYSVAQREGRVKVSVARTGGSFRVAFVRYATANGTADAGTNYTRTRGTLYWRSGDDAPQTISIPISEAEPFLGKKTFSIELYDPENAVLGAHTSAIVTIDGDAPKNAALLTWTPPKEDTNGKPVTLLSGYHIAYGRSRSQMDKSIAVRGARTTSYEISGLTKGTWYFDVAADAENGTQGPHSNIGSKTID
jgi:hypothetical protein